MPETDNIQLNPIGLVETDVPNDEISSRRRDIISQIVIFDEYAQALHGLNEYSHVIVIFWMHQTGAFSKSVVHPRGNPDLPLTGVLASRGRGHPNPIGLAVCDLIKLDGQRLTVRRLDAYHGSPIIDIKPYDSYDSYSDIRIPDWLAQRSQSSNV
jgi:tRNA-Thr(GGU) m(6)t(6)A37 methyltransferase TsaA